MRYRRFGRTGMQISEIALGTVELGLDYGIPSGDHARPAPEAAERLLHYALDLGINLIDTARAYGESEAIIGRALRGRRRDVILASKVVCPPGDALPQATLAQIVEQSVATSLRLLQTDMLDILQVHSATAEMIERGAITGVLDDLRRAGVVQYIGATTYGERAALAALADGRYDCVQLAFNVLDREARERVLPEARRSDTGVVVRSVLLKGALTERRAHLPAELADLRNTAQQLHDIASCAGISLPELAYRFVLSHASVAAALAGTARVSELEQICQYAAQPALAPELLAAIEAVQIEHSDQLNPSNWPI
jgi:aryl-alcohol dehydrogenase-like predicted oxidoreductase